MPRQHKSVNEKNVHLMVLLRPSPTAKLDPPSVNAMLNGTNLFGSFDPKYNLNYVRTLTCKSGTKKLKRFCVAKHIRDDDS